MNNEYLLNELWKLGKRLKGEIKYDDITRAIYSTDASVYKETPLAVTWPKDEEDLKEIITFSGSMGIGLIMRAAGTSLAGQVVGNGIIVDISRHFTRILEVDTENRWVRVQPGVVLDELNIYLEPFGLFFGPETSTSNRCNIGGMVGNNACGSHSLVYGSTRDHVIELSTLLSDGSKAIFSDISRNEFIKKCSQTSLEGTIYKKVRNILENPKNRESIISEFPDPRITRRNTGYALDLLIDNEVFNPSSGNKLNLCKLLTGSEGTLAVTTEIKLNLVDIPPSYKALVCIHLKERNEAFAANLIALKYHPSAVEMMDYKILELTKGNLSQIENRFFIKGDPGALLIVEFNRDKSEDIDIVANEMIEDFKKNGYGYSFPIIRDHETTKVWNLRKAGLGVLSNMTGDKKPVSLIEDTAVSVDLLPDYMADIEQMLTKHKREVVFHAHIGSGELHIRPVLNLKDPEDVRLFRQIGLDTARIVKKYKGSMSGEHGDGRLRGEFIPIVLGNKNYDLLKEIKLAWDPKRIFNPNKITDTLPMNASLRYPPGTATPEVETIFDFTSTMGIIRAAENCNGSGDCRKSSIIGGTMCPVFMATGDEKDTTRARANTFREFIGSDPGNIWDHKEIHDIMDLCISCKGCKSECPSGVDIAKLKAEFMQHWYDKHGIPLRTWLVAHITTINKIGSKIPNLYNAFLKNRFFSGILKASIGFAKERSIPLLYGTTLRAWIKKHLVSYQPSNPKSTVCLFVDEFTDLNDTQTGITAIKLLTSLGYSIVTLNNHESGRTFLSKGLIRKARKIARKNTILFSPYINSNLPLIGIEPSSILTFRDEYPELAGETLMEKAKKISLHTYLIDEFLAKEYEDGKIDENLFSSENKKILLHAHCQQKAISSSLSTKTILSIPKNYSVTEIPSGCCGMAGSFGYEKEHYEISNKIGELVLFPSIRNSEVSTLIAAPGTSCRHQIIDGTGKKAYHPVEILYNAMKM